MVYLEGPGEDSNPRESGQLNDHERRALDRFHCPDCNAPLALIEALPASRSAPVANDDSCELIAACGICDITFTRDAWHARIDVA